MVRSQNGWPANDINRTSSRQVPGSTRKIRVVNGAAGDLLLWVASQFDKLVEDIDHGQLDDWGYAERLVRGGTDLSNHASGTAVDLNAVEHILGSSPSASFSSSEIAKIHGILKQTTWNGRQLVRWGGDYVGRKDPMHFEINDGVTEAQCAGLMKRLHSAGVVPAHVQRKKEEYMGFGGSWEPGKNVKKRVGVPAGGARSLVNAKCRLTLSPGFADATVHVWVTGVNDKDVSGSGKNLVKGPTYMDELKDFKIEKDGHWSYDIPGGAMAVSVMYTCDGPLGWGVEVEEK